jgi:hypothetical protein
MTKIIAFQIKGATFRGNVHLKNWVMAPKKKNATLKVEPVYFRKLDISAGNDEY